MKGYFWLYRIRWCMQQRHRIMGADQKDQVGDNEMDGHEETINTKK